MFKKKYAQLKIRGYLLTTPKKDYKPNSSGGRYRTSGYEVSYYDSQTIELKDKKIELRLFYRYKYNEHDRELLLILNKKEFTVEEFYKMKMNDDTKKLLTNIVPEMFKKMRDKITNDKNNIEIIYKERIYNRLNKIKNQNVIENFNNMLSEDNLSESKLKSILNKIYKRQEKEEKGLKETELQRNLEI